MDELQRISNEVRKSSDAPISIILDDIRSMSNVGSVFRTADALQVDTIYLCGVTPTPPHREIHKTALGATDSVNWTYEEQIVSLLQRLKVEENYIIIGIEQVHESISLEAFEWNDIHQKIAIIFGNEVEGVSDEALAYCDYVIEIPQYGAKHSLNVSVSVGVILWDYIQKKLIK